MEDDYGCEEYPDPTFQGICTCNHDKDDHSWGDCCCENDDGSICDCQAGWEE